MIKLNRYLGPLAFRCEVLLVSIELEEFGENIYLYIKKSSCFIKYYSRPMCSSLAFWIHKLMMQELVEAA